LRHSLRFPGGASAAILAAAEASGAELPESFNPPDLAPEDHFPYQTFWHLKRGEDRIQYRDIIAYADRHEYDDADELVTIVFALDDVLERHREKERKAEQAKEKRKAAAHGRRR